MLFSWEGGTVPFGFPDVFPTFSLPGGVQIQLPVSISQLGVGVGVGGISTGKSIRRSRNQRSFICGWFSGLK